MCAYDKIFVITTMQTNNITTILFDMVGVLLFKKEGYIAKTQAQKNAEKIENLYNHTDDKKLLRDVKTKLELTDEEINQALPCIPAKYEKFVPLWNILPTLKKKYKLAIINNGNALAHPHWLNRFDYSVFNLFVNSALVGIRKPDPKIYLLTCEKLGVTPIECLFMDDKKENVQIAQGLGMKIIWWKVSEYKKKFEVFKSNYI